MTWRPRLCRLLPYLGRRQADADVEEELRLHLELEREAGAADGDARRAARRTLGNAALVGNASDLREAFRNGGSAWSDIVDGGVVLREHRASTRALEGRRA